MARVTDVLLSDVFTLFPFHNTRYHVEIRRTGISYWDDNNKNVDPQYMHFGDITGCHCKRSKSESKKTMCYFTVYAYPMETQSRRGRRYRKRLDVTFCVDKFNEYEMNYRYAQRWKNVISKLARGIMVDKEVMLDVDQALKSH